MSDDITAAACAAQLRKLAEDDRFAKRADDLKSLATDVERADGDAWAGVDLFAAFPSDTGTASSHPNLVERLLGIASGAAVFAPVAWTWWSFRDASRAYRTMLSEGTEADGTSFLSLWATGFDGNLSGSHLLVPMAGRSLVLIILAIALLVAHRITAEFNVRREEKVAKESRHELVSALTQAQRIMNQRRADHPQRIEGIIKSSMQKLQMAHDATRVAVIDLTDSSKQITKDMTKLVKAAREAGEESRRLTAVGGGGWKQPSVDVAGDQGGSRRGNVFAGEHRAIQLDHHASVPTAASDSLNNSLQGTLNEFQSSMGTDCRTSRPRLSARSSQRAASSMPRSRRSATALKATQHQPAH